MDIIRDIEGFRRLKETWNYIAENSQETTPFHSFAWNRIWWEVYGGKRRLFVIVLRSEVEVVAIFPLMISLQSIGICSMRKIQFIGAGKSNYLGPIMAGDPGMLWSQAIEAIFDHRSSWDIVEFGRMRVASNAFQGLQKALTGYKRTKSITRKDKHCGGCPSIMIKGTWEEYYEQRVSKNARKKQERKYRNLEKKGKLSFSHSGTSETLRDLLDEIAKIEHESWKGLQHMGLFWHDRNREFMIRVCSAFADLGWLGILALRLDRRLLSYYIAFNHNNRYYLYSTAYDPEFKKYSPGILLLKYGIQRSFDKGYVEFDFGRGEEQFKLNWSNNIREINKVLLFHSKWLSSVRFMFEKYLYPRAVVLKKRFPILQRITRRKGQLQ